MTRELQGDLPFTKEQMEEFKAEGENHQNFYTNKHYQDTGEPVGHQKHWILTFKYDGETVKDVEGRDEPVKYFYAFEDPTNIDTSKMRNESRIGAIYLDKAMPDTTEEVGRQFDIVETHEFESDDPLTELFQFVNELDEEDEE